MAYDWNGSAYYSGRPNFDLFLYIRRDQTDSVNNRSSYAWELRARNLAGGSSTWAADPFRWDINISGQTFGGYHNLDFRGGQSYITLAAGTTNWFTHSWDGFLTLLVSAKHGPAGQFGVAEFYSAPFSTDRIPKPPLNFVGLAVGAVLPTSVALSWNGPTDWMGATPWGYSLQWSTDAGFTQNVQYWDTGSLATSQTVTGLSPGTTYYFRARARNSATYNNDGWGNWSVPVSATTIASTPPVQVVTAEPSGTGASVVLTPPGGGSGVVSYTIQRRVVGDTATVSNTITTTSTVIGGLTPGTTYEWRSRANYSSSSSPWSSWQAVTQPKPNTAPGDYFDGSSTDTSDVDYTWTGTANNSVSIATGHEPLGWEVTATAGAAVIQRIIGGRAPLAWGTRVLVTADATNLRAGMASEAPYWSDVEPNSTYFGSLYARTPVATDLAAEIEWYTTEGAFISRSTGPIVSLPADPEAWVRLTVSDISPPLAMHAVVVAKASSLTSGSAFYLDDAMLTLSSQFPFFSGATPDNEQYVYEWLGEPYESVSSRTANLEEGPDPLIDPDCDPVPAPPRPPTVPDPCIIETGVWRRYWLSIPPNEVSDWLTMLPTITLTTGPYEARQVRIRIYVNGANVQPDAMDPDAWCTEQIISYIPANTVMVLDGVTERAWATVNDETRPADHLLYGTGGSPATWSELSCGSAHLVSFDVPLDSPEGSVSPVISLTRRAR